MHTHPSNEDQALGKAKEKKMSRNDITDEDTVLEVGGFVTTGIFDLFKLQKALRS